MNFFGDAPHILLLRDLVGGGNLNAYTYLAHTMTCAGQTMYSQCLILPKRV